MKITRWSPDTCDCIIEYEWDETLPPEETELTLKSIIHRCSIHAEITDDNTLFNSIGGDLGENVVKNYSYSILSDTFSIPINAQLLTEVTWEFSGVGLGRILTINAGSRLNNPQKSTLQQMCNTQFGVGKVIII